MGDPLSDPESSMSEAESSSDWEVYDDAFRNQPIKAVRIGV